MTPPQSNATPSSPAPPRERRTPRRAEKAFKWAKEQTAFAYYTSRIGIHQEMEFKGNTVLVEFVGEVPK